MQKGQKFPYSSFLTITMKNSGKSRAAIAKIPIWRDVLIRMLAEYKEVFLVMESGKNRDNPHFHAVIRWHASEVNRNYKKWKNTFKKKFYKKVQEPYEMKGIMIKSNKDLENMRNCGVYQEKQECVLMNTMAFEKANVDKMLKKQASEKEERKAEIRKILRFSRMLNTKEKENKYMYENGGRYYDYQEDKEYTMKTAPWSVVWEKWCLYGLENKYQGSFSE